ncbi:MAG: gliding motility-associated C-terminal domain-containing protein [Candidatus Latescibacteria bacterium]|nr:gliding motility-associated C-terminal domain-containing protein [Candidatus Latescibacterota bacterium]
MNFDRPITTTSRLRVRFTTVLFDEENRFTSQLLNSTADSSENPQFVEIDARTPPVVFTIGFAEEVVDRSTLTISPNPFSPNGDGINDVVNIAYNIAKLNTERDVEMLITDLSGRSVVRFHRMRQSGTYVEVWDGRDTSGKVVPPGIYLYRFHVDADVPVVITGTIAVVY